MTHDFKGAYEALKTKTSDYKNSLALYAVCGQWVLDYLDECSEALRIMAMVQEGTHKIVPVEPTQGMIHNAESAEPRVPDVPIMRIYRAMLAAAPDYDEQKEGE